MGWVENIIGMQTGKKTDGDEGEWGPQGGTEKDSSKGKVAKGRRTK
jgi:hypothetical protein